MVESNVIFLGWNKAEVGREQKASEHFAEFMQWCNEMKSRGTLESFEPCILTTHGGDLNGFIILRGKASKLDEITKSEQWIQHVMRGNLNMAGFGALRGYGGESMMDMMKAWGQLVSSY